MAFNSINFALFFLIVYVLYLVSSHKWQNLLLLIASYAFYSFWDWRFLSLILLSTIVNYFLGYWIARSQYNKRRKLFFILSLCFNLGLLGFFKYFNFFLAGFVNFIAIFGLRQSQGVLNIILPLGISFYTFQVMSYAIDVYWKRLEPVKKLSDFALFVAFFPQVVSGPIERARNMLPQITSKRNVTSEMVYYGSWLFFWGLFKKIVIADNLGRMLVGAFEPSLIVPGRLALLSMYIFTFQVYADFSGYSDMARGLGKLMGFNIMVNFRTPFFAVNPSELWQRWHISLTTWIKEYLFYPLALVKFLGKQLNASLVVIITWALFGFWHGPQPKFIAWGVYHAVIIVVYSKLRPYISLIKPRNRILSFSWVLFQTIVIFNLFSIGLLFFAAPSISGAAAILRNMALNISVPVPQFLTMLASTAFFIFPLAIIEYFQFRTDDELVIFKINPVVRAAIYFALFYLLIFYGDFGAKAYYYFQF